jgi:hypothetical protein
LWPPPITITSCVVVNNGSSRSYEEHEDHEESERKGR